MPFIHKEDGSPASEDEIRAEWNMLKAKKELAVKGHRACETITTLRLSDDAIDDLVRTRVASNEQILKKRFPKWDSWPADAQMGVLSMA